MRSMPTANKVHDSMARFRTKSAILARWDAHNACLADLEAVAAKRGRRASTEFGEEPANGNFDFGDDMQGARKRKYAWTLTGDMPLL